MSLQHYIDAFSTLRMNRSGGAYQSEPVYAGDYNEVMRLFHDEKEVREHAFAAVKKAVEQGQFELQDEIFFHTERKIESFDIFKRMVVQSSCNRIEWIWWLIKLEYFNTSQNCHSHECRKSVIRIYR